MLDGKTIAKILIVFMIILIATGTFVVNSVYGTTGVILFLVAAFLAMTLAKK